MERPDAGSPMQLFSRHRMIMLSQNNQYLRGVILVLAMLIPSASHAYKVVGKITNGTSGRADVVADVEVVNPRGGMQIEQTLRTTNGAFVIDNLSDTSHVYVIRAVYQGVSYPGIVRYAGSDTTFHDITVYDTTAAAEDIRVSIPHLMVRRMGKHFRFETIYEINNQTDPPKAITERPFKIFMPDDRVSVNALYTTELGLPISKDATPTDEKEMYHIHTPLKPGVTRLALSFDVHAYDGAYEYEQVLPYDIGFADIIVDDPSIEVASSDITLLKTDRDEGGFVFSAPSLAASGRFAFRVSGGSPEVEGSPSQNMRIVIQSKATEGGSLPLILIVTLLLMALPVLSSRKPAAQEESSAIESHKNQLLAQIARLDDLHAAGTVGDALYQAKRSELKNRLAAILRLTSTHKIKSSRRDKRTHK
jgi:hypothetical protein